MSSTGSNGSAYSAAGVDYAALDAGKRNALTAALATSGLLRAKGGGHAEDGSRGEPAFVFSVGGSTFAFVLEGLGTKSIIARAVADLPHGPNHFADVAYDTVAAIVNDLCCVGAEPLVVNAYFATGSSDWYNRPDRHAALLDGWQRACIDVGATWGGGESPSLPDLVGEHDIELAGSAIGMLPPATEAILGQDLESGDEIVFVASAGIHANGASLARMLADSPNVLPQGYNEKLPSGVTFGDALLTPTVVYSPLVSTLMNDHVPLHYLSHITGHGMMKLMRPKPDFTYEIDRLPAVPEVLAFIVKYAQMDESAAYATFNMGCGFAIYCAAGSADKVVSTADEMGYDAFLAGRVVKGSRRVMLKPLDITYGGTELDLNPRKAA